MYPTEKLSLMFWFSLTGNLKYSWQTLILFIVDNSGYAGIFDMVHGKPNYLDVSEEF